MQQRRIDTALADAFGHNTIEYDRYIRAAHLDRAPAIMSVEPSWIRARGGYSGRQENLHEAIDAITTAKLESLALLQQAIKALNEEIDDLQILPTVSTHNVSNDSPAKRHAPYTIHISGENSRVNIGSNDHSSNTVSYDNDDFAILATQLDKLCQTLAAQAKGPQDYVTIAAIANASLAAKEKNASKFLLSLSSLGTAAHWVLKVAKDLGIELAAKAIESHL